MLYFDFTGGNTINALLSCVGVFVFCKARFGDIKWKERTRSVFATLSNSIFGTYLVHVLVLDIFKKIGFSAMNYKAWWSVPVISLAIFVFSTAISLILNKIPVVRKYIV